jgi:hypothetical protein
MSLGENRAVSLFIEDDLGDVDDGHLKMLAAEAKAAEEKRVAEAKAAEAKAAEAKAAEEVGVTTSRVKQAVEQRVSESYENDGA